MSPTSDHLPHFVTCTYIHSYIWLLVCTRTVLYICFASSFPWCMQFYILQSRGMKNAFRCCISCVLPCGTLNVVCIVHSDGRVEELNQSVLAGEVMKAHPNHVVKKSSLFRTEEGHVVSRVVVLPPETELKKGRIYFLSPVPRSPPPQSKSRPGRRKRRVSDGSKGSSNEGERNAVSDQYLSEIMSENISIDGGHRRGRVAVWRPQLESISELSP